MLLSVNRLSVIQQPNGLFAVWSDAVDCFRLVDSTEDDVRRYITSTDTPGATIAAERLIGCALGRGRSGGYYDLRDCIEMAERNAPDDMLLPMVKAMLREAGR